MSMLYYYYDYYYDIHRDYYHDYYCNDLYRVHGYYIDYYIHYMDVDYN